ncbi:ubiquitin carboxyl-terminal hydrolase 47 [Malaya genurostris]|uniref:ubiquitin carboxyl-terminal hydrolase 47 n=1 Tax=Malaya genurostris TaxID=325434 RepID=UPI0026F40793|nr:ubiquitin carboxyl-terminal hydrolase 47 [Malaya genurostris]
MKKECFNQKVPSLLEKPLQSVGRLVAQQIDQDITTIPMGPKEKHFRYEKFAHTTMVCSESEETLCIIKDPRVEAPQRKFAVKVRSYYTVNRLYEDVALQTVYPDFELVIPFDKSGSNTDGRTLHDKKHKLLPDAGIKFDSNNTLIIIPRVEDYSSTNISVETEMCSDDDLALGASASPVELANYTMPEPPPLPAPLFDSSTQLVDAQGARSKRLYRYNGEHSQSSVHNYRGLVNQAMTCYLNSLLQALFMTPEFRNALYKWEFDGKDEGKSIPYQLQKLFIHLQTSPKSAVETTDLTRSFGWDSADGWQQHDIQELCRVMFDALEQKFKNTKQADLINRLYEGKMIDYVKCLECNTDKQREDKFLDIPLPVRPFGSNLSYASIEEAMRAFVTPEILDGNNQYHCETCNKKCDAHKGLKFTKFPYILTLHLKRFDFDYQTLHRIKLNDKVTFPQSLNLNSFIDGMPPVIANEKFSTTNGNDIVTPMQMETAENFMKAYDECSTIDSGSALEDDSCFQNGTSVSSTTTTPNDQDDDEGIDMELNGESKSPSVSNSNAPGPYVYELFAIMIHSGSASGGHYYAYIKDFPTCKWFSFNDQTVSSISHEDIQKSFGGSSSKTYYSGAYSSSTNAYMLMYRQIDSSKNTTPMQEDQFPDHIKTLVSKIRDSEANRSKADTDSLQVRVYFENPKTRAMKTYKMYLLTNNTLAETLEEAYRVLKVKGIVPIERCRLVAYDRQSDVIEKSFEGKDEDPIEDIMKHLVHSSELLLETREEHEVFEPYLTPGGIMTKVYKVDSDLQNVTGPISIRANKKQTIMEYKKMIGRKLQLNPNDITLAEYRYNEGPRLLDDNEATLQDFIQYCKVFVLDSSAAESYGKVVNALKDLISIYFVLPNMDPSTLKSLSIPRFIPKPLPKSTTTDGSGNVIHKDDGDAKYLLYKNLERFDQDTEDDDRLCVEYENLCSFFQVTPVEYRNANGDKVEDETNGSSSINDSEKVIQVLINKQAELGFLKYKLQTYLNVPMYYFKIFKDSKHGQNEITALREDFLHASNDGDRFSIELGRVLRKGEYKVSVYYFNVNDLVDDTEKLPFMCNWIVRDRQLVGEVKCDILAHLAAQDEKYRSLSPNRCRLRRKGWKSISKVYTDNYIIGDDVRLTSNSDMILQEVDDPTSCTPTSENDAVVLVRRWNPSEMKLGKFQEVLLPGDCDLKSVLSNISGIPEENLEYTKLELRDSLSVLQIHNLRSWTSAPVRTNDCSENMFQDGTLFYCRDKTEALMELTAEERKELTKKDIHSSATNSPRRERALKIHVDASPKKVDD